MPLVGVLGEHSWRYAWLASARGGGRGGSSSFRARSRRLRSRALRALAPFSPTASSRRACVRAARERGVGGDARARRRALRRVVRNAHEADRLFLAAAAAAYVVGNLSGRRLVRAEPGAGARPARRLARRRGGAVRDDPRRRRGEHGLFACAAFLAGGRTLAASAFALETAPRLLGRHRASSGDDAVRLLRRLDRRRRRARRRRIRALGAAMGGLLLAAARLVGRRPARRRAAGGATSAEPRPRPVLPLLYRARG